MADKEEMKAGMYRLVDKDDSGTITLAELFKLLNEDLGIHVSMDDVYNIVADLDEDGNGELDEEEFAVMLDRLHVYDTSTLDEVIADEITEKGWMRHWGHLFESVFKFPQCLEGTAMIRGGPTSPDGEPRGATSDVRGLLCACLRKFT